MSYSLQHPQTRTKSQRTLKVVYWVLGSLSFLQLLAVGIALTLSLSDRVDTTPTSGQEESPPDEGKGKYPKEIGEKAPALDSNDEELLNSIRPRTVDEMLLESETASSSPPSPPIPTHSSSPSETPGKASIDPTQELLLDPKLAKLLKQSRYYQIEGDMKRSILKLEEASAIDPNNPVVCYYFGLAYEAIRNAAKSREYFLKVATMREKAGKYFPLAAKHLETGFSSPSDKRGDMAFGTILEFREPDSGDGERVVLTIPILAKDKLNIRPEDLRILVNFFDLADNKKISPTRAEIPPHRWISPPLDWADGEETMEMRYHMPPLTEEEITAYGNLKYYGYTAKLYYKGEPMDCHASPNVLFLIEQINQTRNNERNPEYFDYGDSPDNGVLPPLLDSEPAYKSDVMGDSSLLPP